MMEKATSEVVAHIFKLSFNMFMQGPTLISMARKRLSRRFTSSEISSFTISSLVLSQVSIEDHP